jgi:hypothetical protein
VKLSIYFLSLAFLATPVTHSDAKGALPLSIQIESDTMLNGTAGDHVTIVARISNLGSEPLNDVTTYLSLMDIENKAPVDLEDWSVEKGLYIGTIDAGQVLPLNWKIHFVKAGMFSLIIIAEAVNNEQPQVSNIVRFHVYPKHNLNPGHILPVALGTPILLIFVLLLLSYRRRIED